MKSPEEITDEEFSALRKATADKMLEYFAMNASLATEGELHDSSILAAEVGALSTVNIMTLAARDGDFLPELLAFFYKFSKYLEENPPINPYRDHLDG